MHATGKSISNAVAAAILFVAIVALPAIASADSITLMWDANPASELVTGYKVYIGTQPGVYTTTVDVGNALSYVWPNAVAGQEYFIAVSAYKAGPTEGPRSFEISGWSNALPTLTNPGNRTNAIGSAITPLQLAGSDPLGDPLTYAAIGLPPGLTLQPSTGLITGTPLLIGTYPVTATALDNTVPPLTDVQLFTWTITAVMPTLSIADTTKVEGNSGTSNAVFTVTLSAASASTVTVQYDTANVTAAAFTDFTPTPGTLTFTPGTTSRTIAVPILGDTTVEPDETFTTTLATPTNATLARAQAIGTITNDDGVVTPTLSIADVTKTEGNSGTSNAVFTVTLSVASASAVTVQYATSNGTATAGSDYTATSGTLTFAAGTTSQTIAVPVAGDTTVEANEAFTVTLSSPTIATIADGTATGTITNDDTPPAPTVTASPTTALMGATLTATVANGPANPTDWLGLFPIAATDQSNVGWCYLNGSATAPTAGLAGATVTCLSPAAAGQYNVRLFANNSFTKLATSATITVSAPPTLSIADVTKTEGNSGTSNAVFTVTLSASSSSAVTVQYATSNGTATAGSDYTSTSGTLTFAAGTTSQTIAVPVTGDTTFEANETFTVTLSNPTNATIADGTATGTITNDEAPPAPTVTASPTTALTGATLTATVANGPANPTDWLGLFPIAATDQANIGWCYLNGSATAPTTGLASATVTCLSPAAAGQYNVRLFANNSFTKLATSATITVSAPPTLSVTDVIKVEGNSGTSNAVLTVTLSAASASSVTVQYATANGTATAGSDYTTTSGTLTFTAGSTSRTIAVPVAGDATLEADETFTVTLSNPTNATIADGTATGTITNDDSAPLPPTPTVTLTPNPATVGATLTATVANGPGNANDWLGLFQQGADDHGYVDWCFLNSAKTVPATGLANATVTCFTAPAAGQYDVRLFAASSFTKLATSATITVPTQSALGIADVTLAEGNAGTTNFVFTVTLAPVSASAVTVQYATSNGTATAGIDYTSTSGTLTFAAGVTSRTITVPVSGDTTVEGNETFNVTLSAPTNATLADTGAVGTMTNDDSAPLPTLSIADATNAEGNSGTSNAVFTVTLSAASASSVTVQYATANGTATGGSDYATDSGTLTFAPGTTSQTIAVAIVGDTTVEPNETYTVSLSSPTNATIADGSATGTITNDDSAPLPTLSIADVTQAEGNSGTANAVFTVTLSAASVSSVTVQYATANGTATAGSDYTAASGTLTFAAGVTSQTVSVAITGDTTVESDETLNVTLSSPTNATIADGTGTGTITNDDSASQPSLSIADLTLPEGGSGLTIFVFNVTLSAASASPVTVQYATANGTATAGSDYTTTSGTLTFAPGMTSQTVMVSVSGDTTVENNETFTVALSSPTNATIADGSGIGTITNDDFLPTLSIADAPRIEGNSGSSNAVLAVMLSAPSSSSVTVQYATANGTAAAGTDYTTTSGTLTFAPGVTTLTVNVPVLGDTTFEPDETFTVTLSSPTNATILDGTAIGTIVNDDAQPTLPTLSIADTTKVEGNSGTSNAVFTVTLSAASASTVTVQYDTANVTAAAFSDFTPTPGTLTFTPGTTSRTIAVPILGDTTVEPNETFTMTLATPTNATLARAQAIGTITNDDASGLTVTLSPNPATVGSALTATLTGAPGNATDWIGLYPEGTTDMGGQLDWCYLNGTRTAPLTGMTSATVSCFAAATPGRYQLRLFANNGWTKLATSNTITVNGPGIFLTTTGSTLSATVTLGPGNTTDWVGLYLKGAPDTPFIDWCFLNSSRTAPATGLTTAVVTCFATPATPGQYEVRLFENNGWTKVFTSNTITLP